MVSVRCRETMRHALHTPQAGTRFPLAATLARWTETTQFRVVFDSAVDEFSDDALFAAVRNRPNIVLVGVTAEGDVFGLAYRVAVP